MQPLQKTCLIRVRVRVRARARVGGSSVACPCPAQAAPPFQRGRACSSEQPSCRRRSPSLKPDMQMAHAAGCTMLGSESDAACLGLAKQSSSASTRWAFSMQPASGTPCASISRLRSPTGKPASASAPAHAPGAPRQKRCAGVPLSPALQSPRRCVAQRGASRRGYGGRVGGWSWHRVAAPRSGRAARPRRLRWRGRAIERSRPPSRSRPPPIGCRKESPTLRGTTADGDEVGWGWVGVGVSGRGGVCGTGLKMTKQVLATRELRNKGGRAVSAYDYLRHRGATHLCLQSHPALRVGHRARSVTSTRWQGGRGNSPSSSPFARNRAVLLQPCPGRALEVSLRLTNHSRTTGSSCKEGKTRRRSLAQV